MQEAPPESPVRHSTNPHYGDDSPHDYDDDVEDVPVTEDPIDHSNATIGVHGFSNGDGDMITTPGASLSTAEQRQNRPWYRRRTYQLAVGAVVLVTILVAIIVPATRNKQLQSQLANSQNPNGAGTSKPFVFVPQLPEEEIVSNKLAFNAVLLDYYKQYNLNWNSVTVAGSPQANSLEWVCGSATYLNLDSGRRVQRYALGVFYYSTYQQNNDYYYADVTTSFDVPGWTSAANWMSAADECTWEGIECQDGLAVSNILLREHQLSGTLPLELAFLESLVDLDLTSNFVYVDGEAAVTPFSNMNTLTSLQMEDNYIVTTQSGFPPTLASMTSVQQIVMSYNILKGPISESTFAQLSQLTHLEAESNYITGDFPTSLLQNANLLYIYMRRNSMTVHLPTTLARGTLPSIFALWLDTNVVNGGIPSSISNHTLLASLSITNATLTGTIPSELGDLTGLRRVWLYTNLLQGTIPQTLGADTELEVLELYQNQLSGSMPPQVCTTIANSNYEFKALSADCNSVSCTNCCTQCYQ